jgi:hypothetical protein
VVELLVERLRGDDLASAFAEWEHETFGVDALEALHPEQSTVLATMPTATVDAFDGLRHFLHLADPPRFAERLRRWV